ncbi:MAG: type II secretion system protein GspE, partial [Deltaproteobacteria bacterium]
MGRSRLLPQVRKYLTPDQLPRVPLLLDDVSLRFLRENLIIPIHSTRETLTIVTAEPVDHSAVDALRVATGKRVEVCVTDESAVRDYVERNFSRKQEKIDEIIEEIGEETFASEEQEGEDVSHLRDLASEAPIIKLVNMLIFRAVESRASDIHIEPFEKEVKVRYRIDGVLHEVERIPKRLQAAITSRIKLTARLNIAERRLPQDGRIILKVGQKEIDLRVSTVPVVHGESIVLRILDRQGKMISLEELGFLPDTLERFESLIRKPNGIILVTGPTGSGKTTTLYGALERINSPDRKIITVEDPVEYSLPGINQIQVKPKINLTFANILRHIVRQDPDVIMIGEIRDLETAEIAIQAALTGHLVFSTLHTNDAPSSITRLVDMGVEHYLLPPTLKGILAQRLVRLLCPECKRVSTGAVPPPGFPPDLVIYESSGCESCAGTGFRGRTGIFELLLVDEDVGRLINRRAPTAEIRALAREKGMRTLIEDGVE